MTSLLKKCIDVALVAAIIVAAVVSICSVKAFTDDPNGTVYEPTTSPTTAETQEPTQAPTETEQPTTEATIPQVMLYDVPLATDLQLHIISEAEKHDIDPAIIFAMAYRESTYNASSIGDGGDSYGLLQVQPYWHYDRMLKLGCTDLLDPFQNVTVGVDYLAENLGNHGGDIAKALTVYNNGHYPGYITEYATTVLAIAEELRGEAH